VQKLIIEANAENLAKERLAQLAKEGIVTGLEAVMNLMRVGDFQRLPKSL
jgi:hypothetical protein